MPRSSIEQVQVLDTLPYNAKLTQHKGGSLPEGAVFITSSEVHKLMQNHIFNWKPKSEMWAFTHGLGVLGGTSALSGMYFNSHFRRKFKLLHHARKVSYAPAAAIPAATAVVMHNLLVQSNILTRQFDCPTCAEIRASTIQVLAGVVQPFALSVLSCFIICRTKQTIPLPAVSDLSGMISMVRKMARPISINTGFLLGINVIFALFITKEERKASLKVWQKVVDEPDSYPT